MSDEVDEMSAASRGSVRVVATGKPDDTATAITARELFESLTHRQQVMLLEAIGTVPRWVVCGGSILRTAAAPVVFVRAYRSHRRNGMKVAEAAYWALRWAQAFCF
jgi:hypothetical protein